MRHKYRYRIINKIIKNTCIFPPKCYIIYINKEREEKIQYRRLEKWLSQDAHTVQIVGSNPTPTTIRRL